MIEKVSGYLLRNDNTEVLVFEHVDYPEAGRQVPGGTVEEGETPDEAILREFYEETGLRGLTVERLLGRYEYFHEKAWHRKTVFLMRTTENPPGNWMHCVTGEGEDKGLLFYFHWVPITNHGLVHDHGDYLKHV